MLFGMPSESRVPRPVTTQGLFSSGFPKLFLKGKFRHPGGFPGSTVNLGGRMANVAFAVTSVTGANQLGRRPTKGEIFFSWEVAVAASHPDHWKVHKRVYFGRFFRGGFGSYEIEQLQSFQDTFFDTVAPVGFFNCTFFPGWAAGKTVRCGVLCALDLPVNQCTEEDRINTCRIVL